MPNNVLSAPNQNLIDYFLIEANEKGHKLGSAYFRLIETYQSGDCQLTEDDLIYLQSKLGYKPAWSKMKAQELGLIEGDKPAKNESPKPFFEGLIELKAVKVIRTKNGKEMAFLDLLTPSKIPVPGIIFSDDFDRYKDQLIEGIFLVLYGTWEVRDGAMSLVVKRVNANSEDMPF